MKDQAMLERYKMSEMCEKEETRNIWWEINKSCKWVPTTAYGRPSWRLVHPFQNTKVSLGYQVDGTLSGTKNGPVIYRTGQQLLFRRHHQPSDPLLPVDTGRAFSRQQAEVEEGARIMRQMRGQVVRLSIEGKVAEAT